MRWCDELFMLIALDEQVIESFHQVQPFESGTAQPAIVEVVTVT
jgi:hypothetical protein